MNNSSSTHQAACKVQSKPKNQAPKKRKVEEETVMRVRVEVKKGANQEVKYGGPPSDSWSWRKYGQKPVTGSPYRRGYYRCSSKGQGCPARKRVERCKDDPSILTITYASVHNHPKPGPKSKATKSSPKRQKKVHHEPTSAEQQCNKRDDGHSPCDDQYHSRNIDNDHSYSAVGGDNKMEEEEPYVVTFDGLIPDDTIDHKYTVSRETGGNCDFFDELFVGETSSFTSLIASNTLPS